MFERFNEPARKVVVLASEEARGLGHNYIGTEHLLLGLIAEGRGPGAEVLGGLGITLEAVRRQVETIIGRHKNLVPGHVPFTPRAKRILELSIPEAGRYGHQQIDSGHILLAIMAEGQGVAAQILIESGTSENVIRDRMQSLYADAGEASAGEADTREASAGEASAGEASAGEAALGDPPHAAWHEIFPLVEAIEERLSAIERHLGITAGGPGSSDPEGHPPDPGLC